MARGFPPLETIEAGLAAGDRTTIGRALTLVESKLAAHRALAARLLANLPHPTTHRIGITGAPGVGKSTFIDALGTHLTSIGHRVAVLAVDPSSERTGGSILGDKTRMARLSVDPQAFIRPSPAGHTLGGIAARTREMMLVLEAARFDIVLIETVGVGQSETAVRHLCDTFVLLALAGAGDELQGIKRGIMELADVVFVTKADGDNVIAAKRQAAQLRGALRLLHGHGAWLPQVQPISALPNTPNASIPDAWTTIRDHRAHLSPELLAARRADQAIRWLWTLIDERVRDRLRDHPDLAEIEAAVRAGTLPIESAAERLLA